MDKKDENEYITVKKSENFSEWYSQVIIKSGFVDHSEVSGCLVFRPSAYGAWQIVVGAIDKLFREDGIENVYFPLLIPEKFLRKEQEHLEGFSPEVAWVTQTGDTELEERLAIRPTSETIMYASYSKWIRSWRDLPMRYNQWNNVLRWEFKHPTPFIRSREFLWNEGHTVFATEKEAYAEGEVILGIYNKVLLEYLALPGIPGKKTDKEKFAGALESHSIEHIMPDGWAIQGPDWHFDGQNFAKAFDIKFLDKEGKTQYAWQNTFAISTRELGVMVSVHGDDKGLVLPPRVAYIQVVIVPIYKKDNQGKVNEYAESVFKRIRKEFRARMDHRDGYSPGFKFNEWEMKGVPIRIEIGERDMAKDMAVLALRDTGEKKEVKVEDIAKTLAAELDAMHARMLAKAEKFLKDNTHHAGSYEELKRILKEKGGIVGAPWCGSRKCEDKVKDEIGAKITNIPYHQKKEDKKCVVCGEKADSLANFARSY
ncbi:MAG: proline--tRNA ligase [Candidatus Micrarchaeota archaeon]|nr:proline--tRNA ligase [Candidatus Micrarchaeota archaeon]